MPAHSPHSPIAPIAGIGLRSPHIGEVLARQPSAGWLEVHAENYMNRGVGAALLERVRARYALSMHGAGLSLGSAAGIDRAHVRRLKECCDRFQPFMVSERLTPVACDEDALAAVSANVTLTQDTLKRPILIEFASSSVGSARSAMGEPEFLGELARRTGCGLLLDITNVYVSAHNIGFDAGAYIAALPAEAIGEYHLAGHAENGTVLIDSHDRCVAPPVWSLYADAVRRFGKRPTLIEWDSDLPPLEALLGEAMWADLLANAVALDASPSRTQNVRIRSTKAAAVRDRHPLTSRRWAAEHAHA